MVVENFHRIRALKFTISTLNSHYQYTCGPFGEQAGGSTTLNSRKGALGFFGHYSGSRLTALGIIGYKYLIVIDYKHACEQYIIKSSNSKRQI